MVVQTLCVAEPSRAYDFLSLTSLSSHVFIFDVPFTDSFYSSNTSAEPHSSSLGPALRLPLGHFSLGCLPPGLSCPVLIGPGSHEAAAMLSLGFSFAAHRDLFPGLVSSPVLIYSLVLLENIF